MKNGWVLDPRFKEGISYDFWDNNSRFKNADKTGVKWEPNT